jgi:hypothetical protein
MYLAPAPRKASGGPRSVGDHVTLALASVAIGLRDEAAYHRASASAWARQAAKVAALFERRTRSRD